MIDYPTPIERARAAVMVCRNYCDNIRDPIGLASDLEKIILDTVICERKKQVEGSKKRGRN